MSKRVVVAGGTGFIGRALVPALDAAGWQPILLTRHPSEGASYRECEWDGKSLGEWQEEVDGAFAVINLSGESVSKHWTTQSKLAMQESRLQSTCVLGEAIQQSSEPPKVWLNASAIGYYGDRGDEPLDESSLPGRKGDFLVDLCVAWEHEQERVETPNTRKARVRTGVVLGRVGGAFEPIRKIASAFLGGRIGSGRQYFSWIHLDDLVRLYLWLLDTEIAGPVNGTAPEPVTNAEFMERVRSALHRPAAPPVPAFGLQLVSAFGGPEASLLLQGQRVLPKVAQEHGFDFQFGDLRLALEDLLHTPALGA